jgi:hypothetical protein
MPKARIKSKLPIEIVVRADERHHTSVRKPRTHAYRRASEAPVSARAVAVIRPVPIIIALPAVPLHPVWQTPVARLSVSIVVHETIASGWCSQASFNTGSADAV